MSSHNPPEESMDTTWPVFLLLVALLVVGIAFALWAIYLFANAGEVAGLPILGVSAALLLIFGGIIKRRQAADKRAADSRATSGYNQ